VRIVNERIAFISDLHSNLEALKAVLADIEKKRVKKIICLGDVIGYGPDPNPVIDIVRRTCDIVIEGNHDDAIANKIPRHFKRLAAKAALWTRQKVKPKKGVGRSKEQRERWKFLRGLPGTEAIGGWLLAHGSPVSNLDYVYDPAAALEVFERDMEGFKTCFLGHTHVPGIFLLDGEDVRYVPAEEGKRYKVKARKMIVNVGSVGQPRDGDNRACWLLARSDGTFSFRRVPYEIEKCADKIVEGGLDPSLAERLYVGE
jgi:predicted phosphodiesterase